MASNSSGVVICPQCGAAGRGNYCANCGASLRPGEESVAEEARSKLTSPLIATLSFFKAIWLTWVSPAAFLRSYLSGSPPLSQLDFPLSAVWRVVDKAPQKSDGAVPVPHLRHRALRHTQFDGARSLERQRYRAAHVWRFRRGDAQQGRRGGNMIVYFVALMPILVLPKVLDVPRSRVLVATCIAAVVWLAGRFVFFTVLPQALGIIWT